jgi:hypothetical protein
VVADHVLEVVGQLAQELGARRALVARGDTLELLVDDRGPVALARVRVEHGLNPGCGALDRSVDARGGQLGQLVGEEGRQCPQCIGRDGGGLDRHGPTSSKTGAGIGSPRSR